MTYLIITFLLLLIIGPLRRIAFNRNSAPFTISAFIGAAIGLAYVARTRACYAGAPYMPLILIGFAALLFGFAVMGAWRDLFKD